jgi:hypothetical protein
VEQALNALILMVEGRPDLAALVRIAKQLVDCRTDGALNPRALELRNDDGDPVDEAHCVGNDVSPATGQFDLELIDDEEVVLRRTFEIDVPYRLRPPFVPVWQSLGHGTLEQELRGRLIDLHEPVTGSTLQVVDGLVDARIV